MSIRDILLRTIVKRLSVPNIFPGQQVRHRTRVVTRKGVPRAQFPEEKAQLPVFQYVNDNRSRITANRVYVWGFAQYGALGISNYVAPVDKKRPLTQQHRPARLDFADDNEVTNIACGYGFTVMTVKTTEGNKVYGTGLNSDSQLGYHVRMKGKPLEVLIRPVEISVPFKRPSLTKVQQVACGRAHTLILTDKEGIFCLGNNSYGQCGRPVVADEEYKENPRIYNVNLDADVEKIVCGQDNSIFLTKDGELYTCGWGADGQLGTGSYQNEWKPVKVGGDITGVKIVQVSCAADCVLAMSDAGDVFGWGNSEYGQLLKATDSQQLNVPRHLPLGELGKVKQVAASGTMCAVVNVDGEVYVWGYGILGKGPKGIESRQPTNIPSTLFGRNDFSPNIKVEQLVAGLNHFAAITTDHSLYMWGLNKRSCLGLGNGDDQFFPLRVSVPANVNCISLGVDHTAVLCKAFQ